MRTTRVYLDNCCYNRPFDDQSQIRIFLETQAKLHIQNLISSGKLELAYSYMSVFENSKNPNRDTGRIIHDFFAHAKVFIDPGKEEIIERSAERIKTHGIKNKDAIHLASAIEAGCDYFITTDDGILKKYLEKDVRVCSPTEFITIFEVENA